MNPKYFVLALYCSFCFSNFVQAQTPEFVSNNLDQYIKEAMDKWQIPGLSISIVKDNKVIVNKGYGTTQVKGKKAVNANTLFMIGSNTKAFTGAALALLENQGKCQLTDRVTDWYPAFTMTDTWVQNQVTLTDILTHRLGMETFQGDFMWWGSDMTANTLIAKFGKLEPVYDFRTQWGYCNMGYVIAGQCIKKISNQPWNGFLNTHFFLPLEMDRTYCYVSDLENIDNYAQPHSTIQGKTQVIEFGKIDELAPAGSILSSAKDMSHWTMMLLNKGQYNDKQVLPEAVISRVQKPESIIGNGNHPYSRSQFSLYGLGWMLQDYEGTKIVSHTGGVNGFVSSVTLLPEENLGIVILTNTDQNYLYEALKQEIIDAYLKLPFRNYSNVYYSYFEKMKSQDAQFLAAKMDTVNSNPAPALELKNYEGQYQHPIYGNIEIIKKGKNLKMTFEHHPDLTATLEPLGGTRFLCTYSNVLYGIRVFPFVVDDTSVKSFTLSVDDFLETTTYEFVKQEGEQ